VALQLIGEGHAVVLHARSLPRAAALADLALRSAGIVVGDLSRADETRSVAEQVNRIGRMDAVIHNAGVYGARGRATTADGCAKMLAVNTLAPYLLTALVRRPDRLIYLSSDMHYGARGALRELEADMPRGDRDSIYSDSKLYVTALAFAVARYWPEVLSNAVDPGWVPTRMGGPAAPDDLDLAHVTQAWLAVSDDPAAKQSGRYWYHGQQQQPAAKALDPGFQDQLTATLAGMTGVSLR
jgi:NAD(P)-dependent dehydrogenase (short-subunit alcohol dehydrogenase family)